MKLIWLTDIHLNFLDTDERIEYYHKIIAASGDKILITGDIAEDASFDDMMPLLREDYKKIGSELVTKGSKRSKK